MNKSILLKIGIILVPTYTIAFISDKMIYVMPMLVTMIMVVNELKTDTGEDQHRTDNDISDNSEFVS